MKRLRVILLYLLLGAIVNVAVAWVIALIVIFDDTMDDGVMPNSMTDSERWVLERFNGFGTHFYASSHFKYVPLEEKYFYNTKVRWGDHTIENFKPSWGSMDVTTNLYQTLPSSPELPRVSEEKFFEARGWPMRSLWCLRYIHIVSGADIKLFEPRGLISTPILPYEIMGPRVLPLYPIMTGFIFNSLFYTVVLWLLFPGPFVLRQYIRNKRGLCVKCAYDLRGTEHEACPECGYQLQKANPA